MKRLAVLLLSVFTIGTIAACGCNTAEKNNDLEEKINTEIVQIHEPDEDKQTKPECPDCKKHDGDFPAPRRPHKRPDKKFPRPKYAYRKNK